MKDPDEVLREELAELEASAEFQAASKQQQRWERRYVELSTYVIALDSRQPAYRRWVEDRIREEILRHFQDEWRRTERKSKQLAQKELPDNLEREVVRVISMLEKVGEMLAIDSEGFHKITQGFSDHLLALASPFPALIARARFLDAEGRSILEKRAWHAIDLSVRWFETRGEWPRKRDLKEVLTSEKKCRAYFPPDMCSNTWTQVFHKAGLVDILKHGAGGSRYRGSE